MIEKQDKKRVGGLVNFHQKKKKLEASNLLLLASAVSNMLHSLRLNDALVASWKEQQQLEKHLLFFFWSIIRGDKAFRLIQMTGGCTNLELTSERKETR